MRIPQHCFRAYAEGLQGVPCNRRVKIPKEAAKAGGHAPIAAALVTCQPKDRKSDEIFSAMVRRGLASPYRSGNGTQFGSDPRIRLRKLLKVSDFDIRR
jgi:hypothetical protein